jgi:hypothetical protein
MASAQPWEWHTDSYRDGSRQRIDALCHIYVTRCHIASGSRRSRPRAVRKVVVVNNMPLVRIELCDFKSYRCV